MKRKNQLSCGPSLPVIQEPSIKKLKLYRKRCLEDYIDYSIGGAASDEDECEYDRKKRLKINNGVIYTRTITKSVKNKNNIPSYIN
jgi:hypothetical protein